MTRLAANYFDDHPYAAGLWSDTAFPLFNFVGNPEMHIEEIGDRGWVTGTLISGKRRKISRNRFSRCIEKRASDSILREKPVGLS